MPSRIEVPDLSICVEERWLKQPNKGISFVDIGSIAAAHELFSHVEEILTRNDILHSYVFIFIEASP